MSSVSKTGATRSPDSESDDGEEVVVTTPRPKKTNPKKKVKKKAKTKPKAKKTAEVEEDAVDPGPTIPTEEVRYGWESIFDGVLDDEDDAAFPSVKSMAGSSQRLQKLRETSERTVDGLRSELREARAELQAATASIAQIREAEAELKAELEAASDSDSDDEEVAAPVDAKAAAIAALLPVIISNSIRATSSGKTGNDFLVYVLKATQAWLLVQQQTCAYMHEHNVLMDDYGSINCNLVNIDKDDLMRTVVRVQTELAAATGL